MPSSHQLLHRQLHAAARDHAHSHGQLLARGAEVLASRSFEIRDATTSAASTSTSFSDSDDPSENVVDILLLILGLLFMILVLASGLLLLRRARLSRETADLPVYEKDMVHSGAHTGALTIQTIHNGHTSTVVYGQDGRPMLQNPNLAPNSPDNVPEIRITFPDEQDTNGQTKSGRVLIVRVGENAAVGLEPLQEDQLPAYEKEAKGQFQSIDMNDIGGLKDEKDRTVFG